MTEPIANGVAIKESTIDKLFLTSPGESLVASTLLQMSSIQNQYGAAFTQLFGPYTPPKPGQNQTANQRWADYSRYDWSIRQLPAINVYEAETEDKTSSNAWLNGTVNIMVLWGPNMRRSDWARVPMAFKGALQNFFESRYVRDMLDELYWIQRPGIKVPGLNEYGKIMTWSPNVEGIVENESVPVTIMSVKYRLDLRAWYRALEFQSRTKADPYLTPLSPLTKITGDYEGLRDDETTVEVDIPDSIDVSSP